jgi:hypothetical protein
MTIVQFIRIPFFALFFLMLFSQSARCQTDVPMSDSTNEVKMEKPLMLLNDTTYSPNKANGEYAAGQAKGFQLVKNDFTSLNISIYAMVRYLNQMPGNQTWYDHLGRKQTLVGRNDFHWHRSMIWFTGYVGDPRFTYMATVWTIMTTQQTLVYGNFRYKFDKHFTLGMGITPNVCIRSLNIFPFFNSTDRTMSEDALRGGFSMGLFATGELFPKTNYTVVLANNLSTLGVKSANLTRDLAKSATFIWMPTTGEFGPRGGQTDLECHTRLATRFGISYVHSREDRFNNIGTPAPDNTQVRMSDGLLFFETGALADGVTVDKADFDLTSVDLGFKYKGFTFYSEFYYRTLSKFEAFGPDGVTAVTPPISKITDKGYTLQISYMIVPKKLALYGINSMLMDEFKRNPWEGGGGLNFYPTTTRSLRVNAQCIYVYKSAAGGTFGLYTAGQTGPTVTFGVDILL